MPSVVSLRNFANSSSVPIVVFVDMQQEYLAQPRLLAIPEIDHALDNCRRALDHAREIGLPVAFIRMVAESAFFNRATPFVRWIEGFEPARNEMVFERASPSCYSCEPFTALVNQSRGGIVLAGFAGESALPFDLDRCVPPQPQGHLSVRRLGQPRARRHHRRPSPPARFRKFPDCMERSMKRPTGSPRPCLASSATESVREIGLGKNAGG